MAKRSTKTHKDGVEGLGQNGLYWKLLRSIARKKRADGERRSEKILVAELHTLFQMAFNYKVPFPDFPDLRVPAGTSDMDVVPFHNYYSKCQEASIRLFGISGMEEDSRPFDHGGKRE